MYSIFMKGQYDKHNPLKHPRQFCRQLRWAFQRALRGFSDWDAGEIDSWISYILPDMLDKYLELKGREQTPFVIISGYYDKHKEELDMTKEEFFSASTSLPWEKQERCKLGIQNAGSEWIKIVSEMRDAFYMVDTGADDLEDKLFEENIPFNDKRWEEIENLRQSSWEKGCELLKKWGRWLWT